ncbi:MAG: UvrD-helicase domain-containing protein [Acidobacteria bacterium]|nr:UvrD-helicase domain-containing protein [Acidobacteriota bacterium]
MRLAASPPAETTVENSWLYRLFSGGFSRLSLTDHSLHLGGGHADAAIIDIGVVDDVETRHGWFWSTITMDVVDGPRHAIGGLRRDIAKQVVEDVSAAASARAAACAPALEELDRQIRRLIGEDAYARHSAAEPLWQRIEPLLLRVDGTLVADSLPRRAAAARTHLREWRTKAHFEAAREQSNSTFVRRQRKAVQHAARGVSTHGLTIEQANAIATDEDVTLVLAGAGTGKTSVITGKIAHLVRNQHVPPKEILVLAFNKKAASEIRDRLPDDLGGVEISTFHAFGNKVIGKATGRKPILAPWADDEWAFGRKVETILQDAIQSQEAGPKVLGFLALFRNALKSAFDFKNLTEYTSHLQRGDLRTLTGIKVKSFEEVQVANFLSMNGVDFEYERPYEEQTATGQHRQYQPDFYLPDYNIYIEHFALNEDGFPPPYMPGYRDGVMWKRRVHLRNGTDLIETYSHQYARGVLHEELRNALLERGVKLQVVSIKQLLDGLRALTTTWLARLVGVFLKHVKNSAVSREELENRATTGARGVRERAFLAVFDAVFTRYEEDLEAEDAVDFEDMIGKAAEHIRGGAWKQRYRHVLVDEFQDISAGRMALIAALRRPGLAYFLVGDDWQSIYRFAGSDVSLVRRCGEYLGHVRERTLTTTFRYGEGILEPTAAFVQRNPHQTQRSLRTDSTADDEGITIVASESQRQGVAMALDDISVEAPGGRAGGTRGTDDELSVLCIGRYRHSRESIPDRRRRHWPKYEFSTAHGAKGREADYTVVLDLTDDRMGFPSQLEDDPLLDLVLPPTSDSGVSWAEERRLFYVATTRARRGAYLVADRVQPSEFVREVRATYESTRQVGTFVEDGAHACARCSGFLVNSKTGKTLRCTNWPLCPNLAHRCANCKQGYAIRHPRSVDSVTCTHCTDPPDPCPECEFGVLVRRTGAYGPFIGCTEYRSEPPCEHTQPVALARDAAGPS